MAKVKFFLALAGSMALLLGASQAGATEFVQNGGFETGNLTDWTKIGDWATPYNGVNNSSAHSGSYALYDGNYPAFDGEGLAGVSQQLATVSGQSYNISLWWFVTGNNDASNQLYEVLWDGTVIDQISGAQNAPYTNLTFTVTGVGNDTIAVEGFSSSGYNITDDISVMGATSATPLPGALPLFASGLGALGLLWRRKKKAAPVTAA